MYTFILIKYLFKNTINDYFERFKSYIIDEYSGSQQELWEKRDRGLG